MRWADAHHEYREYVEAILEVLKDEHRPPTEDERREAWRLRDQLEAADRGGSGLPPLMGFRDAPDGLVFYPRPVLARRQHEIRFGPRPEPLTEPPATERHRPGDAFPWATFERLDELLADRWTAKEKGGPKMSQVTIASELSTLPPGLSFDDTRVQRAEQVRDLSLEAKGWDLRALLRSHPEFCVGNDAWVLPGPKKARDLLGL